MVQWLRVRLPMQGTRIRGFKPWSGRIPHAAEQLGPCATTTEPALQSPHAKSPCLATREATAMRGLHTTMKSSPTCRNWRRPAYSNEDPTQPKINK